MNDIVIFIDEAKKPKGMVDHDSKEFHQETLDNEDAIFAALDKEFGPIRIDPIKK